jgi:chromosome segregation ATPase
MNRIIFLGLLLFAVSFFLVAQDTGAGPDTVDISSAKLKIQSLQTENSEHTGKIGENDKTKAFLENRISESEARLKEIDDAIDYANGINLELNGIRNETADREGKAKIDASRKELLDLLWNLKNEKEYLSVQTESDKADVQSLAQDTDRRNKLIAKNKDEIASLEASISFTQGKLDDLQGKLDSLKSKIDQLNTDMQE